MHLYGGDGWQLLRQELHALTECSSCQVSPHVGLDQHDEVFVGLEKHLPVVFCCYFWYHPLWRQQGWSISTSSPCHSVTPNETRLEDQYIISLLCSVVTSHITPCRDNKVGASVHHLPVILLLLMRQHQRQHGWSISTSSPCCVLLLLLISPPVETTKLKHQYITSLSFCYFWWDIRDMTTRLEHQYITSVLCSSVLIKYSFR